jgi:predicted amidohydrolase
VSTLRLTLVQADTRWHDAAGNRAALGAALANVAPGTDLVVLPEMFSTGFTMASTDVAERMDGPTVAWLSAEARRLDAAIVGSVVVEDEARCFNRLIWATPDGALRTYDKRHLFRMADEHLHYGAGAERLLVSWRGFRICPLVCYDLRFPVFARNRRDGEYDVLLVVANWPAARQQAWNTLLRARAIENQCWSVGVNRVGVDGKGLAYRGGSAVYDWLGDAHLEVFDDPGVFTVRLALAPLSSHRRDFPVWRDADAFELK